MTGLGQPKEKAISALAFYRIKEHKGAPDLEPQTVYVGNFLGPFKVPLLVLKIFLCRELRCPTGPERDTPHLPELCLNGASQHFLVDIMNNAALPLQLRGKDSLLSHHKPTSTATCQ